MPYVSAAAAFDAADWSEAGLTAALRQVSAETGVKGRALYEPLRLALTGELHGPPFAALLTVRGRDYVLRALGRAMESNE